jgi:sulfur carrier protein
MKVTINIQSVELPEGATLADAIQQQGVKPQGIATALNGNVVSASSRATTVLADGDSILLIKAFCGG